MKEYTLRELCEKCNVTRRAVQWYEKHGLVKPCGKNKMGYLLYNEDFFEKVKEIKSLQNYGFKVSEIKEYFNNTEEVKKTLLKHMVEQCIFKARLQSNTVIISL